nr:reverse transcriptase domain-containing protein [Tanacetum cinerariifolium]
MSTCSSARNLFPPLDNLELTIRRSSRSDPTLLNNSEMAAEGPGGTFMKRRPKECYNLIENMTAHHNDWKTSAQRTTVGNTQNVYAAGHYQGIKETIILTEITREGTNSSRDLTKIPQPQVVTTKEFTNFMKANDTIQKNMQTNMTSLKNSNLELKNMFERETEATKDMVHPSNNRSTEDVQPPVVPTESSFLNSEPVISPIIKPVASPKLPEKLGDPGKFLIPYDFLEMAKCLALVDLGASINLIPLSLWNKLSLPGTFHFSADFVVVDFDADPRVPLILGRSFLKTRRALIYVFKGELTLRVGKEDVTFNLNQTSRYSSNYNYMTVNHIDVIDMACEEYSQEVLGFFDVIASGNPTPYYDPIVSTTSLTLTPFENSDFFLEEVDAFLALEDDPTSPEVDQSYLNSEGDILLLEAFLNDDPSLPPPNQGNYMPEVELKDLPPHLEYAFLEGDDKSLVIIAKYLSMEEKTTLITVLKSYKRAIAWKLLISR